MPRIRTLVGVGVLGAVLGALIAYRRGATRPTERGILHPRLRRFTIERLNPFLLERGLAGSGRPYAILVHHGRTSGRVYESPVVAEAIEDGFLVPLPYGAGVDWMRNLAAAGGGQIRIAGETIAVEAPTIVEMPEAAADLPAGDVLLYRLLGVDKVAHLPRAMVPPAMAATGESIPEAPAAGTPDVEAPVVVPAGPAESPGERGEPAVAPEPTAVEPEKPKRSRRKPSRGKAAPGDGPTE